jgi:serine/threonine-protein kinase
VPGEPTPDERFLAEAVVRGVLDEAQAADCRRILSTLAEVEVTLAAADVAIRKGLLSKDQADELKRALARRRVGRYEVLERLGRGGTGVVWRARDVRLGRVVALKLLARPREPDDLVTSYHARFQREARAAVTLNHVNIVRGLDYGEADGYVFFAMELVSGESAAERLRREGRLDESEALRIALQVVEALQYVREFGLVHRDLKPENLLLTPNGEVKVCDLGLAKPTREEAARLRDDARIAGTPLYMAPEQVRDPAAVDWRTDVYGLGATLYHLLTGRPPFLPGATGSVLQRHVEEAPEDPREHVLELSAGASAVVLKMLAKDPSDRYACLEDLASDLAAVTDGRPPSYALRLQSSQEGAVAGVLSEAHGVRGRLRARRRRGWRLAAATTAAVAVLAVAWSWRPEPSEHASVVPRSPADAGETGEVAETERAPELGPGAPAPDPGRQALANGRALERRQAPLDEQIEHYAWVAERHAGHPSGEAAAKRVAELRVELEGRAAHELTRRRLASKAALESGDVVAARDELLAFPGLYLETDAYTVAMEEAARITREGRAEAERDLEQARLAVVEWRFAEAERLIERARRTGLTDLPVQRVVLELELEQHARDAERVQRRPRWQLSAGRALMVAVDDPAAATRLLDAEVAGGALRTYVTEVDALRSWLPRARRARVRLDEAWTAWAAAGRRLELRIPGPPARELVGVPLAVDDRRLLLHASGDAPVAIAPSELPLELLTEAISPGGAPGAAGVDDVAAFLLATRRLEDAVTFQAPPDLVDVVRVAAIAEARAHLDRAAVLVAEGEVVAGRAALNATIAFVPWFGEAHTALGRVLVDQSDLDAGDAALRRALEAPLPDPAARVVLAQLLERRGRFADAEGHLRLFLDETAAGTDEGIAALRDRVTEDLPRVRERRIQAMLVTLRRDARNALRAGRGGEAAGLFEQVLAARPDDPEALLEIGRLHRDAGRVFDAFRAWTRLVAAHPEDRRARDAQRGIAGLERFRSGVPAGRDAQRAGRAALREDRLDDAVASFREAIRMSPFLVAAHLGLAEALLVRGERHEVTDDVTAAARSAEDAQLLSPGLPDAVFLAAQAAFLLGDLEGAVDGAERASKGLREPSSALLLAGRALYGLDRLDEALLRFEEAFESREHPDPLFWQAKTLQRQGRRLPARMKLELLYDRWGAPSHLEVECARLYNELRD